MDGCLVPGPHLVWLNAGCVDRSLVGGKGASLHRLFALGAPVPPAFALTTHAYRSFVRAHGFPSRASDVRDEELPALRAAIESAAFPGELRDLVCREFDVSMRTGNGPCSLAVRSSATAEDSAEFSFAGLHDTILDVCDPHGLERAIARCWASLWSDRAVVYRRAGGVASDEDAIAVVVQQLIRSDVSFVVFTADPIKGRAGHLVIAATWGLGEAVVSGLVVPDHIVIGPDGDVIEYAVGDKHLMVIPGANPGDGVREVPVPRAIRTQPALTSDQAVAVGTAARQLSSRLGYEADIEGAFAGGSLYLLQVRPITTLGPRAMNRSIGRAGG